MKEVEILQMPYKNYECVIVYKSKTNFSLYKKKKSCCCCINARWGYFYLCILFIYRFLYSRPKNAKMSIQLVVVLLTLANKCVPEERMEKIVVLVTLVLH